MGINNCKEFIKTLKKHPEIFYIIHYSSEGLYDETTGLSPRITSIAVTHFSTEQTVSFSTHAIAEELRIARHEVLENFAKVEAELLERFHQFTRDRRDKYWVHWNMRNLTYGFEHLEHRHSVLGGKTAHVIPVERRLNLNDLLEDRYGEDYAQHPRMISLMEMNGGRHREFLSGPEEVQAFKDHEFNRMHNSTLSKVGFYSLVMEKLARGKLKTASTGVGVTIDKLFESRGAKVFGFFGTTLGIAGALWKVAFIFIG